MAGYIGSRTNNALVSLSGASGTISDDVVFPTGHVIQTAHNSKGDENSDSTSSTSIDIVHDSSNNNEWFVTISNITSGNKILLMFTFSTQEYGPSADSTFGGYGICRDSLSNIVISTGGYSAGINTQTGLSGTLSRNSRTLTALDTPTSTSHTYYLTFNVISTAYQTLVNNDTPAQFFAFEVQQ